MASRTQFEEKSFEAVMNLELFSQSGNIWSPGQVLEHWLGYDASGLSNHPVLLRMFGQFPIGNIDRLAKALFKRRNIPIQNLKRCNLFIQYKRPEFLKIGVGKQRAEWKKNPFYRFDLLEWQHKVLRYQDNNLSRSLVCYSAPQFHLLDDLFVSMAAKTCVSKSVFIRPRDIPNAKSQVTYSANSNLKTFVNFSDPIRGVGFKNLRDEMFKSSGEVDSDRPFSDMTEDFYDFISGSRFEEINKLRKATVDAMNVLTELGDVTEPLLNLNYKYRFGQIASSLLGVSWRPLVLTSDRTE